MKKTIHITSLFILFCIQAQSTNLPINPTLTPEEIIEKFNSDSTISISEDQTLKIRIGDEKEELNLPYYAIPKTVSKIRFLEGAGITTLPENFFVFSNIKSIDFRQLKNLRTIPANALRNCSQLQHIHILLGNLIKIDSDFAAACPKLQTVTFYSSKEVSDTYSLKLDETFLKQPRKNIILKFEKFGNYSPISHAFFSNLDKQTTIYLSNDMKNQKMHILLNELNFKNIIINGTTPPIPGAAAGGGNPETNPEAAFEKEAEAQKQASKKKSSLSNNRATPANTKKNSGAAAGGGNPTTKPKAAAGGGNPTTKPKAAAGGGIQQQNQKQQLVAEIQQQNQKKSSLLKRKKRKKKK